jgi:benzoate membrane transport protein
MKNDISLSAVLAGFIVVLVGMTSSAVVVFQAAQAFGATASQAGSWLGALCIGLGVLTLSFSFYFKTPLLMAWSTPGAVLLITAAKDFTMNQGIGAFIFSAFLVLLVGITGWFQKAMNRIPLTLTSALLAGVLLHFCIDAMNMFAQNNLLIGLMLIAYIFGRKYFAYLTMLIVLAVGLVLSMALGILNFNQVQFTMTEFHFFKPDFSIAAFVSLGIPLFVVTMASQNLTGISLIKSQNYKVPISTTLSFIGLTNILIAFWGGFKINFAAITAAIALGKDAHPDQKKRYIAGVVSGCLYIFVGLFAGSVTSLFAAFPKEMISAIAGFALFGTVTSGLEKAFQEPEGREASFITFAIAASGFSFLGIGSAFWAIVIGCMTTVFLNL